MILLAPGRPIGGERSAGSDGIEDDDPLLDDRPTTSDDESERIVEEAIRRIEEAEHEWARSWEPERPAE